MSRSLHERASAPDASALPEASRPRDRLGLGGLIAALGDFCEGSPMFVAGIRTLVLPGAPAGASADREWRPTLSLSEQTLGAADRRRPVLYVHGATFPSANAIMFKFDGLSWADAMNSAGFSVWGLDFAGYGGSERYPEMAADTPPPGEPLGRAPAAARQIERAVRAVIAETGVEKVSVIAHSWGAIAVGRFAGECPELVDRLVFFAPFARRETGKGAPALGPWRLLTIEEQHKRFVEDTPAGHPAVLLERDFPAWSELYLASDPTSGSRSPPSVKTPNGPIADIMAAWSGSLAYDPAKIVAPLAIVRGEWDSLCADADAAWLLAALTSAPEKADVKIAAATHLMHLKENRSGLHRAAIAFLSKESRFP